MVIHHSFVFPVSNLPLCLAMSPLVGLCPFIPRWSPAMGLCFGWMSFKSVAPITVFVSLVPKKCQLGVRFIRHNGKNHEIHKNGPRRHTCQSKNTKMYSTGQGQKSYVQHTKKKKETHVITDDTKLLTPGTQKTPQPQPKKNNK